MSGPALMLNGLGASVTSLDASTASIDTEGTSSPKPGGTAKVVQRLVSRASRAFVVHQQMGQALVGGELAFRFATSDAEKPATSLVGSALATRIALLRLTCYATAYPGRAALIQALQTASPPLPVPSRISPDQVRAAGEAVVALLRKAEYAILSHLWNETLVLFAPTHAVEPDAIIPTPAAQRAPAQVPSSAIVGCVLAALNLGDAAPAPPAPQSATAATDGPMGSYRAARHMCEAYLASVGDNEEELDSDSAKGYARIVALYSVEVLGKRMAEWEYAEEVVRYSRLPEGEGAAAETETATAAAEPGTQSAEEPMTKRGLMALLVAEKAHGSAADRERRVKEAAARVQAAVAEEQAKRTEEAQSAATKAAAPPTSTSTPPARSTTTPPAVAPTAAPAPRPRSNSVPRSPPGSFAQSRETISKTLERHHARDREREAGGSEAGPETATTKYAVSGSGAGAGAGSGKSSAALPARKEQSVTRTAFGKILARWGPYLPALVPIVGILLAILYRIRRRRLPPAPGQAPPPSRSLLANAVAAVWDTLRMGTQVTYL